MLVSPSILNADYLNLEKDILRLEAADADFIHIDIMDGVFVANTTWGPPTVAAIRKATSLPLEVHLMIDQPERLISEYIKTGADMFIIHPESTVYLRKTLLEIRSHGVKAGIALKLETPVDVIINCLDLIDMVLILSCDEGFGGQPFHSLALNKIAHTVALRKQHQLDFIIEVDGGINLGSGERCKKAGADIIVAGSFIFNQNMTTAIANLKEI